MPHSLFPQGLNSKIENKMGKKHVLGFKQNFETNQNLFPMVRTMSAQFQKLFVYMTHHLFF